MKNILLTIVFLSSVAHADQYIIDNLGDSDTPLHNALAAQARYLTLADTGLNQNKLLIVSTDSGLPSLNRNDFKRADTIILVGKENSSAMMELLGYSVNAPMIIIHHANVRNKREISKLTFMDNEDAGVIAKKAFEQILKIDEG